MSLVLVSFLTRLRLKFLAFERKLIIPQVHMSKGPNIPS